MGYILAGETEEEALENIKEGIQLYLQPESIKLAPSAIALEIIVS
ncbi:hypothetical protein [Nostoc sp. C117]